MKTPPWKISKGIGALTARYAFGLVLGTLGSVLVARILTVEDYAVQKLVLSFLSMVSVICLPGLSDSLTISAARGTDGNFLKLTKLKIRFYLLAALCLLATSAYYAHQGDRNLAICIAMAAFLFPLYQSQEIWTGWLNGKGEFSLLAKYGILQSVLLVSGYGIAYIFELKGVRWILFASLLPSCLVSLIAFKKILSALKNHEENKSVVRSGHHYTAANFLQAGLSSDRLFLHSTLGEKSLGIYAAAMIFPDQAQAIAKIFNQILVPQTYGAKTVREAWTNIRHKFWLITAIFWVIGLIGWFLIPILIPLLLSQKFVESVPYARVLWVMYFGFMSLSFINTLLRGLQKIAYVYVVGIAQPVLFVLLMFVLAKWDIWGLIWARFISANILNLIAVGTLLFYLNQDGKKPASLTHENT